MCNELFFLLSLGLVALCYPPQPYVFPHPELPGVLGNGLDDHLSTSQTQLAHSEQSSRLIESVLHIITKEEHKALAPITTTSFTTHSVIGSIPPVPASSTSISIHPSGLPSSTTISSLTSQPSLLAISTATITDRNAVTKAPSGNGKEWRVTLILLAVIGGIVGIVLVSTFFKSIWRFIREKTCCRSDAVEEDMVPDWHGGSWQFKIANEEGNRYPMPGTMETSQVYAEALHNEVLEPPSLPPRLAGLSPPPPPTSAAATIQPYYQGPLSRHPSTRTCEERGHFAPTPMLF
ncbi:hypothetical protein AAF712_004278 [Marasmius tenuissimus]|uniref:Uncharacterized protein n=1 Tax=Marasmius tenuissimus TaxID=585030 RepID=A0ABR3A4J4_9AGAR